MWNFGEGLKKKTRFFALVIILSNISKPHKLLGYAVSLSSIRFDLMIICYYINCCYLLFLLWLFHKINLFYYNLLCQSFDPYGLLLVSYIHRSVSVTKFLYVCQMWELQFFWTFSRCHKKIMIRSIMHVSVLILSHFYTEHRLFFIEDIFTSSWCSWCSLNFHVPFKYIFFQSILSSEVYVYHNRFALLSFWKCLFKQVKSSI